MEPISVEEAQRLVLERAKRLDAERVPLERAYGRVLAEPVGAAVDLPPFPSSAMDGFALRSADTAAAPVSLTLAGSVAAGAPSTRPLGSGEAMAISTGGVVPDGADAVIPIELARTVDGRVEITETVTPGTNVRGRGGDVTAGALLLDVGTALGAAQVGALAAAGIGEVRCAKRPRVGILVTGSELVKPGDPLRPGEIYESTASCSPRSFSPPAPCRPSSAPFRTPRTSIVSRWKRRCSGSTCSSRPAARGRPARPRAPGAG